MPNKEIEDIIQKYKKRLSEELGENKQGSANFELTSSKVTSREYEEFKQDILIPELNLGDAVLFNFKIVHGSSANKTLKQRRAEKKAKRANRE